MALQVIIDSPTVLEPMDFLKIARQDLAFTFRSIDINKFQLFQLTQRNPDLASALLTIEWEHLGSTRFIERHMINLCEKPATLESKFLLARIKDRPKEINDRDLWQLRKNYGTNADLLAAVIDRMTTSVISFAERLTADPLEISDDFNSLQKSICDYGFSSELNEVLGEIDRELATTGSAFDQVGTMQHIRSFFEKLHFDIGQELRRQKPSTIDGTPLAKCGQAIDFLCRKGVITEKVEALGKSLYGILSDGDFGCHAIKATRDYTRLCRNIVVEYAVTLFFELERRLAEPGS